MRGEADIVARIAGRQHGRVSREQLLALGVDGKRIERWIADGRLRRVHRGVYAVGHIAPSTDAEYIAAVLACGEGAVLSTARPRTSWRCCAERRRLRRSPSRRPRIAGARASSSTA